MDEEPVRRDSGLVAEGISATFGRRPVVRDVSLQVSPGEIVGLLGPNGAGKTSCFYLIAGLRFPSAGSIFIDGTEVTHMPLYRRARLGLGYLPQDDSIFRGMTVEQNIMAVLETRDRNRRRRRETLETLMQEVSVAHIRKTPAMALSGGERRRVEFARCLASQPRYLLLDEPFAGLDPIVVDEIKKLADLFREKQIGVLITDHNAQEILKLVDRVYVIFDGAVIRHGNASTIRNDPLVQAGYLGTG